MPALVATGRRGAAPPKKGADDAPTIRVTGVTEFVAMAWDPSRQLGHPLICSQRNRGVRAGLERRYTTP